MRPKFDFRTASRENYERFCKEHPEHTVTFKQYLNVLYTWNEFFMTHILETGEKVKLPYGFGYLAINKKPTVRYYEGKDGQKHCILPVDWVKSKELGKKVYIFNNHTDGWRFKWYWFKNEALLRASEIWRFKPGKKYSKLLNKYLTLKKDKDYVKVYHEWSASKKKYSN